MTFFHFYPQNLLKSSTRKVLEIDREKKGDSFKYGF